MAATLFQHSRTPLNKWFLALYLTWQQQPTRMTACCLAKRLNINYVTARRITNRIRDAVAAASLEPDIPFDWFLRCVILTSTQRSEGQSYFPKPHARLEA